jgi:putative hydrolase of HD superfamily
MQKENLEKICRAISVTPDDALFLQDITSRFSHVAHKLALFDALPAVERPAAATEALKIQPRSGWLRIGIPPQEVETVFDHVENCKTLASRLTEGTDCERLMQMIAIHDLPEAVIGDFTPFDKISPKEKHKLEELALRLIFSDASQNNALALWNEFEENATPAAKLARDIDRIDMAEKAIAYMNLHPDLGSELQEFVVYAEERITTSIGTQYFKMIKATSPLRQPPQPPA